MNLYDILVKMAQEQYDKIKIDLCNKTLKVGRKTVIKDGEPLQYKINFRGDEYEFDSLIETELDLDILYEQYKYSSPSERDCSRHYFKALSANNLSDAQLVTGMQRLEARVRLEAYILLASISGMLKWHDESKWYWQGKDTDFIILKQFI